MNRIILTNVEDSGIREMIMFLDEYGFADAADFIARNAVSYEKATDLTEEDFDNFEVFDYDRGVLDAIKAFYDEKDKVHKDTGRG